LTNKFEVKIGSKYLTLFTMSFTSFKIFCFKTTEGNLWNCKINENKTISNFCNFLFFILKLMPSNTFYHWMHTVPRKFCWCSYWESKFARKCWHLNPQTSNPQPEIPWQLDTVFDQNPFMNSHLKHQKAHKGHFHLQSVTMCL